MGGFILRRAAIAVPLIVFSSFLVFMLVAAAGDPLAELRSNPGIPKSTVDARRRELGLDRPVLVRYLTWAKDAVRGDFGESYVTGGAVRPKLVRSLGVTLRLLVGAVLLAVVLGVTIGVLAALRQYSRFDYMATFFAFVFFSMPVFWLAAVLKDLGIRLNDLLGFKLFFTVWSDRLGHLILPALTLILIQVAGWSRYQRSSMLEVLNADYVRTAKAKGLPPARVITRHAMRNALIPIVTLVAIDFGLLLSGAVITERVFGWAGMGRLLLDSLTRQDINVVQAWLLVSATMVIVFNLLADILYGYLDPRIRRG